ncbi:uncharacterized protein [Parasteatoda tepidariorum]|uniref:uncharacterized protein isoform X2 n=1 Tax=Parasteatoda tepidariorum TaxID=114398 RepID=UPI001C719074|nr:uncharacterized protein LOC107445872 isoform X2 [Parasteatoda tepidariorum]
MGLMQTFLLTYGVLLLLHSVRSCPILGPSAFGNVTHDQDLEVGSLLKLQCSLFPEQAEKNKISVKNLSLKLEGKPIRNINIIDDLTLEYVVPSATVNDTGVYNCFVDIPDVYNTEQLVCNTYVAVGFKPLPVETFSCISEEYTNLTCTWKAPFNPIHTKYKLYDYYFQPFINRTCPEMLNSTSCQYRMDTKPVYVKQQSKIHFILEGNNSLGINKQFINIDHYKIVKPGKPKFIICTNVTQNSLSMQWNAPKGLDYGEAPAGLIYHIRYYSVSTNLPGSKEIELYAEKNLNISIVDLVPHTLYEFEVKVRLNISGDEYYWSEPSKHTEKTKSDVPYLAPETTGSAFDMQIIAGNRSITLYWKSIPSELEHGEGFHYAVRYHEYHVVHRRYKREVVKKPNYWVTVANATSFTFEHLDIDSAYIFNILSANKIGNSSNDTTRIVVDKIEKMIQGPKDIMVISYGKGNYSLTWKNLALDVSHFTLFWCQTLKSRPAKCDGPIEWLHTAETSHELLLPDHHTNYQFAVSANRNDQTSGMVWAPCIASYAGVRYSVSEMKLTIKNATSLRAQWALSCKAQEKVIKKYLISYCSYPGKCVDSDWKCETGWSNVTVSDSSRTEYILSSLKPYTCYVAFIRVLTNSGWSENSDYAYESTMTSAPSDSPRNVIASVVPVDHYSAEIEVIFDPPTTPNGVITKYEIYYNESSSEDSTLRKEVKPDESRVRIKNSVHYYTNYSIQVSACVQQACSKLSTPVYVFTGISNPSPVNKPRVEQIDSTSNITWDPPNPPNGPINFYEVELYSNDTGKSMHYVVNSSSSLSLKRECNVVEPDETVYELSVRAVNLGDLGSHLYGEYSHPTKMTFCSPGKSVLPLVGFILGGAFAFVIVVIVLSVFVNRCRKEVISRKNINIKLPLELETPFGNSLNSFKLKNGLQKTAPDSSIPCDRAYERLCTFAQEGSQCDPDGWGENDVHSHRNNSGESNKSGVSSADTTRTVVSMDSSVEQECDTVNSGSSIPSHSGGTNAEDLEQLSGPFTSQFVNNTNMTFSRCFVRPRMPAKGEELGIMPPYCKFSEIPSAIQENQFSENPYQSRFSAESFLQSLYKINSEPSLYGYGDEDLEVVSTPNAPPYSKFGLARSNTHLCEMNRPNVGYSKFGTMYSPNGIQNNAQIFTVFMPPNGPLPVLPLSGRDKCPLPKNVATNQNSFKSTNGAYSKFGVGRPAWETGKNYVPVKSVLPANADVKSTDNSSPKYTASDVAYPSQTNNQPQETLEMDDDPRSLLEVMAADERFAAPSVKTVQNLPIACNGILPDAGPISELGSVPIANGVDDTNHKFDDSWKYFNGDAPPIMPLRVDDYEEPESYSPPKTPDNREISTANNNYILLSELAKQKLLSVNSIQCNNLTDTPVASV